MNNKRIKQAQRDREKNSIIFFIVALLVILLALMIMNKREPPEVEHKTPEYEQDVKTYDGSLNRNISNPFGSE
jgi:hypothetical protein